MAARCTVCTHSARAQIELKLARRVPLRLISAQHDGLGLDALSRHRKNHMSKDMIARLGVAGVPTEVDLDQLRKVESESLIQNAVHQRARLFNLLDTATEAGDYVTANRIEGTVLKQQEFLAKLVGELVTHTKITTNSILVAPEYLQLRSALTQALRPYPEARRAVAEVLRQIEGSEPHFDGCLNVRHQDGKLIDASPSHVEQ